MNLGVSSREHTSSSTSGAATAGPGAGSDAGWRRVYSILVGLSTVLILLQGLWAGLFLEHDGERDAASGWIDMHARGADLAIVLTVVATAIAVWKMRQRRDLWIGTGALAVLLVLEGYLGGLIRDEGKDALTVVHVPLAMALMALAVWLRLRLRRAPTH